MAATVQRVSKNGQPKVLVVDDHPLIREGIAQVIRKAGGLEVCGEADRPETALQVVSASRPDVAVVDLALSAGSGLGLIRDLKAWHPGVRILVLSMHDESLYAERVLRAGASGYIMKHELQRLAVKEPARAASSIESLSDRELEVFRLVAQGLSTREVAERLYLSIKTVETHLDHVKAKLGLESGRELFRYAIVWSLEGH
jgi:DNA-binding NarL/FixJ family response regulator